MFLIFREGCDVFSFYYYYFPCWSDFRICNILKDVYLVHLDTTLDIHITPNIKSEDIQKEEKMTCVYMCHVEMILGKSMDSLCIPGL